MSHSLIAYLDASGSALDRNVRIVSVGGFIASEEEWQRFDVEWERTLKEFGVSELHMREFAHFRGDFKSWRTDEAKRVAFLQALAAVIHAHTRRSFGASIDVDTHRWFNERFAVEEVLGGVYSVAAFAAMSDAMYWKVLTGITEPIVFRLEAGDNEQQSFRRVFSRLKPDPEFMPEPPSFHKKKWTDSDGTVRYQRAFEACDFVVYERAKAASDAVRTGKLFVRQSLRLLKPESWKIGNRHVMWNQVRNFGIPLRQSRSELLPAAPECFVGSSPLWTQGTPFQLVPPGPLCFVGLDAPLSGTVGRFNN